MALDPEGGAALPTKKKKRKRQPVPVMGEQAAGGTKVPAARRIPDEGTQVGREPYLGSTNPAFQRMGFSGDIFTFNRRAETAAMAFASYFGVEPSPGLLLDLVRAPVQTEEYEDLFQIPLSFQRARAQSTLQDEFLVRQEEDFSGDVAGFQKRLVENIGADPHLLSGLRAAVMADEPGTTENYEKFVTQNADELDVAFETDPASFERYVGSIRAERDNAAGQPTLQTMGFGEAVMPHIFLPFTAIQQVTEGFLYAPAGVYLGGKAVGFDVRDISTGRDYTPSRSAKLAAEIAGGVKKDFSDPLANPGYVLLDTFGALSGGVGTGARLGAAGKLAKAGAPKTAVAKALVARPLGGVFEIGGERQILSENTLTRLIQRANLERRNRKMEARRADTAKPVAQTLTRRNKLTGYFSTEKKVGRLAASRQRVEFAVASEPIRELKTLTGHSTTNLRLYEHLRQKRVDSQHAAVWATISANTLGKIPKFRRGLQRGEQKAIQVLSTDMAGGWQAKLKAHRDFHRRQISDGTGDVSAHRRHLADLALAEQVFKKPRKRFRDAARLTKETADEAELIGINNLGLSLADAESRLARYAQIIQDRPIENVEAGFYNQFVEGVPDIEAVPRTPESFYLKSEFRPKAKVPPGFKIPTKRPGQIGYSYPRPLPEFTHYFSGESLYWGDFRMDATNLAGEAMGRRVRQGILLAEHKRLLARATDERRSAWDIPILVEGGKWSDEVRGLQQKIEEGEITKTDLDALPSELLDSMHETLFPKTEVSGSKWVDSRLVAEEWRYPDTPGPAVQVVSGLQEPIRAATLFARLAYDLNLLGNVSMGLFQSLGYPANVYRAVRMDKKSARTMDAVMGEGKTLSFVPGDVVTTKASRALAHVWSAMVDRVFRRASFVHHARRMGYKTDEDFALLLNRTTTDQKLMNDRVEIGQRAKKDLVEFDNQTPFEKNTLRHMVFVYPWISRSFVWSLRTIAEHPIKTASLVELGDLGREYVNDMLWGSVEESLGKEEADRLRDLADGDMPVPKWFEQTGYIPLTVDDDGNPLVVNPASINSFNILNDAVLQAKGLFTDEPYTSPQELLGPAGEFGVRLLTGQDAFGNDYEAGALLGALGEVVGGLPQATAIKKAGAKVEKGAAPEDRPAFVPEGFWSTYGSLIAGGFAPKTADMQALVADYLRDQPTETRHALKASDRADEIMGRLAIEKRSIAQMEAITSKDVLKKPIPEGVKSAINFNLQLADAYARSALFGDEKWDNAVPQNIADGRTLTTLEKSYVKINVLRQTGRVSKEEAVELAKDVTRKAAKSPEDLRTWNENFSRLFTNDQDLADWHDERDAVLGMAARVVEYTDALRKVGLFSGSVKPDREAGLEMGRKYAEFKVEDAARRDAPPVNRGLETLTSSEDRAWMDSQDVEVSIDGKKYPSPVRLDWARLKPEQRAAKVADWTTTGWESLSNFQKEILGKKVAPKASYGWYAFSAVTDALRGNVTAQNVDDQELAAALPEATGSSVAANIKRDVAKYVDKYFAPGFYKDYLFATRPKYQRLQVLPVVTKSSSSKEWKEVFALADQSWGYLSDLRQSGETGIGAEQDRWREYVNQELYPWIKQYGSEGFQAELELLGGVDLLTTLTD